MSELRRSAQGKSCIACGADDGTIVLAHRNEGKCMGKKLMPDWLALHLCSKCHYEYDQGRSMDKQERRNFFNENYPKQIARWINNGQLTVKD